MSTSSRPASVLLDPRAWFSLKQRGTSIEAGALLLSALLLVSPALGQVQTVTSTLSDAQADNMSADRILAPAQDPLAAGLAVSLEQVERLASQLAACRRGEVQMQTILWETQSALELAQNRVATEIQELVRRLSEVRHGLAEKEQEMVWCTAAANDGETMIVEPVGKLDRQQEQLNAQTLAADEERARILARAANLESELFASQNQVADLKELNAEAQALGDRLLVRMETLEAELADAEQSATAESQNLRLQVETTIAERENLRTALSESEWELAGIKRQLTQVQNALTKVRARLPVSAGGSRTDEQIQNEVAGHMIELRALYKQRGEIDVSQWQDKRDILEAEIRTAQLALAESIGAKGLYWVQRDDTMAKISQVFYGQASGWPQVYAANRHVLESPDRVFPGVTLVIP